MLYLDIAYDYMNLQQANVLSEWEWTYWEKTYIDFLPGGKAANVNQTLRYTSTDSIYSARFHPAQTFTELRLGLGYLRPLLRKEKWSLYAGLSGGYSLFSRNLSMKEEWTKRFLIDSSRFDYQYTLLHFAPAKHGTKLYLSPLLAFRYRIASFVDVNLSAQWLTYSSRKNMAWLEKALAVLPGGEKWLPVKSKSYLAAGFSFKY